MLFIAWFCVRAQDMFEKVNQAYEFLCSKSKLTEGPDPKNIVLILRAQTILFSRYKDGETSVTSSNDFGHMTLCCFAGSARAV